jgi:hypothetical protein
MPGSARSTSRASADRSVYGPCRGRTPRPAGLFKTAALTRFAESFSLEGQGSYLPRRPPSKSLLKRLNAISASTPLFPTAPCPAPARAGADIASSVYEGPQNSGRAAAEMPRQVGARVDLLLLPFRPPQAYLRLLLSTLNRTANRA